MFVSLLVHGSILFSLDRTVWLDQTKLLQVQKKALNQKEDKIQFEFVEAPKKVHAEKPEHAAKISDRDALNQDLLQNKSDAHSAPHIKTQGLADQLAQRRGGPSQTMMPKVEPRIRQTADSRQQTTEKSNQFAVVSSQEKKTAEANQEAKPQVEPRPEIQNLAGRDKITTQEASKAKSAGAPLFGVTSFEATGSGMGAYMKNLKERIWLAWFPYLAFQYPRDFRSADAVISFTLNARGEVKIVKVVESQGSPLFASFCVDAVQRASGFGEVPQEMLALMGKDEIEIRFGFHYR